MLSRRLRARLNHQDKAIEKYNFDSANYFF